MSIVKVDLVGAEGPPDVTQAVGGLNRRQQGQRAGTHDLREVGGEIDRDEVIGVRRFATAERGTPRAVLRDVVGDEIEYQAIALTEQLVGEI